MISFRTKYLKLYTDLGACHFQKRPVQYLKRMYPEVWEWEGHVVTAEFEILAAPVVELECYEVGL